MVVLWGRLAEQLAGSTQVKKEKTSVQVNISARHGTLDADMQSKIREKAEKLRRLFDRVSAITVTANLEHHESPSVELSISVERTDDFIATESASNVLAALDGAIRKIEQQLRRHKEKRRDHRAPGIRRSEPPAAEQREA
jgi:putative sigma-54 modulation protein